MPWGFGWNTRPQNRKSGASVSSRQLQTAEKGLPTTLVDDSRVGFSPQRRCISYLIIKADLIWQHYKHSRDFGYHSGTAGESSLLGCYALSTVTPRSPDPSVTVWLSIHCDTSEDLYLPVQHLSTSHCNSLLFYFSWCWATRKWIPDVQQHNVLLVNRKLPHILAFYTRNVKVGIFYGGENTFICLWHFRDVLDRRFIKIGSDILQF